jgi:hypothetical protein
MVRLSDLLFRRQTARGNSCHGQVASVGMITTQTLTVFPNGCADPAGTHPQCPVTAGNRITAALVSGWAPPGFTRVNQGTFREAVRDHGLLPGQITRLPPPQAGLLKECRWIDRQYPEGTGGMSLFQVREPRDKEKDLEILSRPGVKKFPNSVKFFTDTVSPARLS